MSKSEHAAQTDIRLEVARLGNITWRNNSGAFKDEYGNFVRCGLANESAKMNKKIKSSDLIGLTRVFITPEMVGSFLGVFTAIEAKPESWKHTKKFTEHETAQATFHDVVRKHNGLAGFATCVDDYRRIISNI